MPSSIIQFGSQVLTELNGSLKQFLIVDSARTDPARGRISELSPLGSELLGHQIGDEFQTELNGRKFKIRICGVSDNDMDTD